VPPSNGNQPAADPTAKAKRLNPIKRKKIEDRVQELEAAISQAEDEIAKYEIALQDFISADETQRQSQELEQQKSAHSALIREWEALSESLQEVE
jgi:ATP-binding cassette subfamily F protein 3